MTQRPDAGWLPVVTVFSGFFIMGFVDMVGIATNYIRGDLGLSAIVANLIPMMVFVWFLLVPIPTGIAVGKVGRRNVVLFALVVTIIAMLLPYLSYNFYSVVAGFALLGIGNTILQVTLNPLIASMFGTEKTASILTTGQFIKGLASILGPVIIAFVVSYFNNWKLIFPVYAILTLLSTALLLSVKIQENRRDNIAPTFKGTTMLLGRAPMRYCFFCVFLVVGFDVGINILMPEILVRHGGILMADAGIGTGIYFTAKTAGAFIGALILMKVKAFRYLLFTLCVAVVSYLLLIWVNNPIVIYALIFITSFACANVFSIVFSFALKAFPAKSNEVSALMIMAITGGALIPVIQGWVNDQWGFSQSLLVVLGCLFIMLFLTLKMRRYV